MKKTALILALVSLVLLSGTAIATLIDQTAQPPPTLAVHAVTSSDVAKAIYSSNQMASAAVCSTLTNSDGYNIAMVSANLTNAPAAYPLPMTFGEVTLLPFDDPTLFEAGRADTLEVNLTSVTIADMSPKEVRATMFSGVAKGMIGTRPMELTLATSRGPTG